MIWNKSRFWKKCKRTGIITDIKKEVVEMKESDNDELGEQMVLIRSLIQEHMVRSILCVPVIICIIYLLYQIFTYNFHNFLHGQSNLFSIIQDFLPIIAGLIFCDVGLWLFYGPKNYKEVKEKVTGEYQKSYGIVSHIIAFIVAVVLVLIY